MDIPLELSTHLDKIYELVYQQVRKDYEQQRALVEEGTTPQRQGNEAQQQEIELLHNHLSEREQQLAALQNRYDDLSKIFRAQETHLQQLENDHRHAQHKLERHQDLSGEHDDLYQQLEQLKMELEESNINRNVLKHHYRQLTDKNEELKTMFEQNQLRLQELELHYQQQTNELAAMKKEFATIEQLNRQYLADIDKHKADLSLAMTGYYDGVLNKDKLLSKNIPHK